MASYTIVTDSGSDLPVSLMDEWGVRCADLTFKFDHEDKEYTNREMPAAEFYKKMVAGGVSKTSAVSIESFKDIFREELEKGNDILYIGFDSAISNTYNAGVLAANELEQEFPERRIIAVDTLCASLGQGLLVWYAVNKKNEGAPIEETWETVCKIAPTVATWFTVDDLIYLKRGGRISAATAFVGNLLNIRPILHVAEDGTLESVTKARGRKASLQAIADEYLKHAVDASAPYIIGHGESKEDAELLEKIISEKTGKKALLISDVGPVIGSHTGPGIIVLIFPSTVR